MGLAPGNQAPACSSAGAGLLPGEGGQIGISLPPCPPTWLWPCPENRVKETGGQTPQPKGAGGPRLVPNLSVFALLVFPVLSHLRASKWSCGGGIWTSPAGFSFTPDLSPASLLSSKLGGPWVYPGGGRSDRETSRTDLGKLTLCILPTQLLSLRMQVRSLASISGLKI